MDTLYKKFMDTLYKKFMDTLYKNRIFMHVC
jgi:hypothetical protein